MKGINKFVKSHKLVILLLGAFIFGVMWSIYVNDDVICLKVLHFKLLYGLPHLTVGICYKIFSDIHIRVNTNTPFGICP